MPVWVCVILFISMSLVHKDETHYSFCHLYMICKQWLIYYIENVHNNECVRPHLNIWIRSTNACALITRISRMLMRKWTRMHSYIGYCSVHEWCVPRKQVVRAIVRIWRHTINTCVFFSAVVFVQTKAEKMTDRKYLLFRFGLYGGCMQRYTFFRHQFTRHRVQLKPSLQFINIKYAEHWIKDTYRSEL